MLAGCTDAATTPTAPAGSSAFWSLTLNHRALVLSLEPSTDTVQLVATPRDANGSPIADVGVITYTTRDTTISVTSNGFVRALYATSGTNAQIVVTSRDTVRGITHADTAIVMVTATALPPFVQFSLQPQAGDSAKRSRDYGWFFWPVRAHDAANTVTCDEMQCPIPVAYQSSNIDVATFDRRVGRVAPQDTGYATLSVSTFAYGRAYADAVRFRIGLGIYASVFAGTNNPPSWGGGDGMPNNSINEKPTFIVGVGASVQWHFYNFIPNKPVVVTFSPTQGIDTSSGQYGDVTPTGNGPITSVYCDTVENEYCMGAQWQARRFTRPGMYQVRYNTFPDRVYYIDVRDDN